MKKRKTIAVCASVSFYTQLYSIEKQLKALGYFVKLPKTAIRMKKQKNFDVTGHKTWYQDPSTYHVKTALMKHHFQKIIRSDAVLIVNLTKNNINGYIGGNTLMEMTIAFHYKKPIYILHPISDSLSIKEEIYGMQPVFLNGDIEKLNYFYGR